MNAKIGGFMYFFGDFGLRHTFQERQHSRETVAPSGVCKYIVSNVSCWINELRFVRSGPSNMHRCRAFPFALAGLFLFYTRKQLLLSARLSRRSSVYLSDCPSVTRVDQSKTVQARTIKSSSAVRKTLVSGTVKLFHKFKRGHSERGR